MIGMRLSLAPINPPRAPFASAKPEAPVLAAMRAQTDETGQAALAVVQAVVMSEYLTEAIPAADAKPTRRRARL